SSRKRYQKPERGKGSRQERSLAGLPSHAPRRALKTGSRTVTAGGEGEARFGVAAAAGDGAALPRAQAPAGRRARRLTRRLPPPQYSGVSTNDSALRSCQASSVPRTRFMAALTSRNGPS